jgi:hypothetical protein
MRIAPIAAALLVNGCVTTQPQSIGRDTYLIETMGTNLTYGPALRAANAFCSKQDKKMQLVTANKGGIGVSANTSLTFMCLDENDPRYGAH